MLSLIEYAARVVGADHPEIEPLSDAEIQVSIKIVEVDVIVSYWQEPSKLL